MKMMVFYLLIALLAGGFQDSPAPQDGKLTVSITGLRNTEGQVGILLFDQEEGFPSTREKAVREILLPIDDVDIQHVFSDLPFGEYAVSVMHDENGNNQLDTNFFGIPKEGNGVSRDVKNLFGPPKFKQAVFSIDRPSHSIAIKMNY